MREGTNVTDQKDTNGKLFHNEIIKTAETKGSGWVDYMFPQARTNRAVAEMGLCEQSDDRWSSGLGSFRLLSPIRFGNLQTPIGLLQSRLGASLKADVAAGVADVRFRLQN